MYKVITSVLCTMCLVKYIMIMEWIHTDKKINFGKTLIPGIQSYIQTG